MRDYTALVIGVTTSIMCCAVFYIAVPLAYLMFV